MSQLGDLYQALILDHNAKPRNFGAMEASTHEAEGINPLCGDRFKIYLKIDGDVISEVRFEGSGCAISKASASLMTAALKGKTTTEAMQLFQKFHELITGDGSYDGSDLGKLSVFSGVREYPSRVKCATLSWHAIKGALDGSGEPISTE